MDPITALSLCLLIVPAFALMGWLAFQFHDRLTWQRPTRERRGFEVLNVRPVRSGYSFVEVMFAVVVLGVGFIMLAAMFPVAMSQQQSSQQESNAAALARSAFARINAIAFTKLDPVSLLPVADAEQNMPATEATALPTRAPFVPFDKLETAVAGTENHGRFHAMSGDLILPGDRRYAFVPFYQREFGDSRATVIVVAMRVRDRSTYDSTDVTALPRPNFMPRPVKVKVTNVPGGTDTILVSDFGVSDAVQAVAEGSYIIVSQDPARDSKPAGVYNGYVFRVGLQSRNAGGDPIANQWDLAPGSDYKPLPGAGGDWLISDDAVAYVVGREPDPGNPSTYRGDAQDISAYTTFIQVK